MMQNKKSRGGIVPVNTRSLSKRRTESDESPLLPSVLKASLLGLLSAIGGGIIFITAVTAISYANPDSTALVSPLALVALMPAMFTCGFVTAKKVKEAPLLCGILSGGITTLVTMLFGAILTALPSSGYALWQSVILHAVAILFSVLGAFAGNLKKRPNPAKHRFGR